MRMNEFDPYFWKKRNEIDFVVKHADTTLSAVNVWYTDDIPVRELKGPEEFLTEFGDAVRARVIITKDTEKEEDGIIYVPLYRWLLGGCAEFLKGA